MSASKSQVLKMYKSLMRESGKFNSYNFRSYALRRITDAFHENKTVSDPNKLKELHNYAQENLEMIRRQVVIGHLYSSQKLVIEKEN